MNCSQGDFMINNKFSFSTKTNKVISLFDIQSDFSNVTSSDSVRAYSNFVGIFKRYFGY